MIDNINLSDEPSDIFLDIDPDSNIINNLFHNINSIAQSCYYSIDNYNSSFQNQSNFCLFFIRMYEVLMASMMNYVLLFNLWLNSRKSLQYRKLG